MPFLHSPSRIINPLAHERRFGFGSGMGGGESFTGPLDAYASGLVALYSVNNRLLASYSGSLFRVRRSSDSAETNIGALPDGSLDVSALTTFLGGGSGFIRTLYDQSGNDRHQQKATAAAQPQIGVDGNGQYYIYAPGAGSSTTSMSITGLSIAAPEFTIWSVAGSSGVWLVPLCLRDNTATKERAMMNYGNSSNALIQDNATGTVPTSISQTSNLVYSTVLSAGSAGSRMTDRLSTTTGTRNASPCNIEQIHLGMVSGGAAWLQNAPFYLAGVWAVDQGPTANFAALAALGETLITAAQ